MKKVIFIFLLITSCSNESDYPQLIIGTWELSGSESTYYENGKAIGFSNKNPKNKYISKYTINGNVICSKLLVTPTPQYTHVGYEGCVEINSLNESKLVTIDANNEINTYVKKK